MIGLERSFALGKITLNSLRARPLAAKASHGATLHPWRPFVGYEASGGKPARSRAGRTGARLPATMKENRNISIGVPNASLEGQ